jgi:hypothetical protein
MSKGSKVEVDRKISKMIFRAPLQLILIDPNRPYLVIFRSPMGRRANRPRNGSNLFHKMFSYSR